ncbi:MAG: hypothetical protein ACO4CU_14050 [Ilumatobacteraceae bacterium]
MDTPSEQRTWWGVVAAGGVGSVGAVVQAPILAVVDIRLSGGL